MCNSDQRKRIWPKHQNMYLEQNYKGKAHSHDQPELRSQGVVFITPVVFVPWHTRTSMSHYSSLYLGT